MPNVATQPAKNRALAERVYNMLMEEIEEDLTLENIPLLDAKYAGETSDEHDVRMKRYDVAYKAYDRELNKMVDDANYHARVTQRAARKQAEEKSATQEQEHLTSIASAFG